VTMTVSLQQSLLEEAGRLEQSEGAGSVRAQQYRQWIASLTQPGKINARNARAFITSERALNLAEQRAERKLNAADTLKFEQLALLRQYVTREIIRIKGLANPDQVEHLQDAIYGSLNENQKKAADFANVLAENGGTKWQTAKSKISSKIFGNQNLQLALAFTENGQKKTETITLEQLYKQFAKNNDQGNQSSVLAKMMQMQEAGMKDEHKAEIGMIAEKASQATKVLTMLQSIALVFSLTEADLAELQGKTGRSLTDLKKDLQDMKNTIKSLLAKGAKDKLFAEISEDTLAAVGQGDSAALQILAGALTSSMQDAWGMLRDDFDKTNGNSFTGKNGMAVFGGLNKLFAGKTSQDLSLYKAALSTELQSFSEERKTELREDTISGQTFIETFAGINASQMVFGKGHLYRGIQVLSSALLVHGISVQIQTAQGKGTIMPVRSIFKALAGKPVIHMVLNADFVVDELFRDQQHAVFASFGIDARGVDKKRMSEDAVVKAFNDGVEMQGKFNDGQKVVVYIGTEDMHFTHLNDQSISNKSGKAFPHAGKYAMTIDEMDAQFMVLMNYINAENGRELTRNHIDLLQKFLVMAGELIKQNLGTKDEKIAQDTKASVESTLRKIVAGGDSSKLFAWREGTDQGEVVITDQKRFDDFVNQLYQRLSKLGNFSAALDQFLADSGYTSDGLLMMDEKNDSEKVSQQKVFGDILKRSLDLLLTRKFGKDYGINHAKDAQGQLVEEDGRMVVSLFSMSGDGSISSQRETRFMATLQDVLHYDFLNENGMLVKPTGDTRTSGQVSSMNFFRHIAGDIGGSTGTGATLDVHSFNTKTGEQENLKDASYVRTMEKLGFFDRRTPPVEVPEHITRARRYLGSKTVLTRKEAYQQLNEFLDGAQSFRASNYRTQAQIFADNSVVANDSFQSYLSNRVENLMRKFNDQGLTLSNEALKALVKQLFAEAGAATRKILEEKARKEELGMDEKTRAQRKAERERTIEAVPARLESFEKKLLKIISKENAGTGVRLPQVLKALVEELNARRGSELLSAELAAMVSKFFGSLQVRADKKGGQAALSELYTLKQDALDIGRIYLLDGNQTEHEYILAKKAHDLGMVTFAIPRYGRGTDYERKNAGNYTSELTSAIAAAYSPQLTKANQDELRGFIEQLNGPNGATAYYQLRQFLATNDIRVNTDRLDAEISKYSSKGQSSSQEILDFIISSHLGTTNQGKSKLTELEDLRAELANARTLNNQATINDREKLKNKFETLVSEVLDAAHLNNPSDAALATVSVKAAFDAFGSSWISGQLEINLGSPRDNATMQQQEARSGRSGGFAQTFEIGILQESRLGLINAADRIAASEKNGEKEIGLNYYMHFATLEFLRNGFTETDLKAVSSILMAASHETPNQALKMIKTLLEKDGKKREGSDSLVYSLPSAIRERLDKLVEVLESDYVVNHPSDAASHIQSAEKELLDGYGISANLRERFLREMNEFVASNSDAAVAQTFLESLDGNLAVRGLTSAGLIAAAQTRRLENILLGMRNKMRMIITTRQGSRLAADDASSSTMYLNNKARTQTFQTRLGFEGDGSKVDAVDLAQSRLAELVSLIEKGFLELNITKGQTNTIIAGQRYDLEWQSDNTVKFVATNAPAAVESMTMTWASAAEGHLKGQQSEVVLLGDRYFEVVKTDAGVTLNSLALEARATALSEEAARRYPVVEVAGKQLKTVDGKFTRTHTSLEIKGFEKRSVTVKDEVARLKKDLTFGDRVKEAVFAGSGPAYQDNTEAALAGVLDIFEGLGLNLSSNLQVFEMIKAAMVELGLFPNAAEIKEADIRKLFNRLSTTDALKVISSVQAKLTAAKEQAKTLSDNGRGSAVVFSVKEAVIRKLFSVLKNQSFGETKAMTPEKALVMLQETLEALGVTRETLRDVFGVPHGDLVEFAANQSGEEARKNSVHILLDRLGDSWAIFNETLFELAAGLMNSEALKQVDELRYKADKGRFGNLSERTQKFTLRDNELTDLSVAAQRAEDFRMALIAVADNDLGRSNELFARALVKAAVENHRRGQDEARREATQARRLALSSTEREEKAKAFADPKNSKTGLGKENESTGLLDDLAPKNSENSELSKIISDVNVQSSGNAGRSASRMAGAVSSVGKVAGNIAAGLSLMAPETTLEGANSLAVTVEARVTKALEGTLVAGMTWVGTGLIKGFRFAKTAAKALAADLIYGATVAGAAHMMGAAAAQAVKAAEETRAASTQWSQVRQEVNRTSLGVKPGDLVAGFRGVQSSVIKVPAADAGLTNNETRVSQVANGGQARVIPSLRSALRSRGRVESRLPSASRQSSSSTVRFEGSAADTVQVALNGRDSQEGRVQDVRAALEGALLRVSQSSGVKQVFARVMSGGFTFNIKIQGANSQDIRNQLEAILADSAKLAVLASTAEMGEMTLGGYSAIVLRSGSEVTVEFGRKLLPEISQALSPLGANKAQGASADQLRTDGSAQGNMATAAYRNRDARVIDKVDSEGKVYARVIVLEGAKIDTDEITVTRQAGYTGVALVVVGANTDVMEGRLVFENVAEDGAMFDGRIQGRHTVTAGNAVAVGERTTFNVDTVLADGVRIKNSRADGNAKKSAGNTQIGSLEGKEALRIETGVFVRDSEITANVSRQSVLIDTAYAQTLPAKAIVNNVTKKLHSVAFEPPEDKEARAVDEDDRVIYFEGFDGKPSSIRSSELAAWEAQFSELEPVIGEGFWNRLSFFFQQLFKALGTKFFTFLREGGAGGIGTRTYRVERARELAKKAESSFAKLLRTRFKDLTRQRYEGSENLKLSDIETSNLKEIAKGDEAKFAALELEALNAKIAQFDAEAAQLDLAALRHLAMKDVKSQLFWEDAKFWGKALGITLLVGAAGFVVVPTVISVAVSLTLPQLLLSIVGLAALIPVLIYWGYDGFLRLQAYWERYVVMSLFKDRLRELVSPIKGIAGSIYASAYAGTWSRWGQSWMDAFRAHPVKTVALGAAGVAVVGAVTVLSVAAVGFWAGVGVTSISLWAAGIGVFAVLASLAPYLASPVESVKGIFNALTYGLRHPVLAAASIKNIIVSIGHGISSAAKFIWNNFRVPSLYTILTVGVVLTLVAVVGYGVVFGLAWPLGTAITAFFIKAGTAILSTLGVTSLKVTLSAFLPWILPALSLSILAGRHIVGKVFGELNLEGEKAETYPKSIRARLLSGNFAIQRWWMNRQLAKFMGQDIEGEVIRTRLDLISGAQGAAERARIRYLILSDKAKLDKQRQKQEKKVRALLETRERQIQSLPNGTQVESLYGQFRQYSDQIAEMKKSLALQGGNVRKMAQIQAQITSLENSIKYLVGEQTEGLLALKQELQEAHAAVATVRNSSETAVLNQKIADLKLRIEGIERVMKNLKASGQEVDSDSTLGTACKALSQINCSKIMAERYQIETRWRSLASAETLRKTLAAWSASASFALDVDELYARKLSEREGSKVEELRKTLRNSSSRDGQLSLVPIEKVLTAEDLFFLMKKNNLAMTAKSLADMNASTLAAALQYVNPLFTKRQAENLLASLKKDKLAFGFQQDDKSTLEDLMKMGGFNRNLLTYTNNASTATLAQFFTALDLAGIEARGKDSKMTLALQIKAFLEAAGVNLADFTVQDLNDLLSSQELKGKLADALSAAWEELAGSKLNTKKNLADHLTAFFLAAADLKDGERKLLAEAGKNLNLPAVQLSDESAMKSNVLAQLAVRRGLATAFQSRAQVSMDALVEAKERGGDIPNEEQVSEQAGKMLDFAARVDFGSSEFSYETRLRYGLINSQKLIDSIKDQYRNYAQQLLERTDLPKPFRAMLQHNLLFLDEVKYHIRKGDTDGWSGEDEEGNFAIFFNSDLMKNALKLQYSGLVDDPQRGIQAILFALMSHELVEYGIDQLWVSRQQKNNPATFGRKARNSFEDEALLIENRARKMRALGGREDEIIALEKKAQLIRENGLNLAEHFQLVERLDGISNGSDDHNAAFRDLLCETYAAQFVKYVDGGSYQKDLLQTYKARTYIENSIIPRNKAAYYEEIFSQGTDPVTRFVQGDKDAFEPVMRYFRLNPVLGWWQDIELLIAKGGDENLRKAQSILDRKWDENKDKKAKGEQISLNPADYAAYQRLLRLAKYNPDAAAAEVAVRKNGRAETLAYALSVYGRQRTHRIEENVVSLEDNWSHVRNGAAETVQSKAELMETPIRDVSTGAERDRLAEPLARARTLAEGKDSMTAARGMVEAFEEWISPKDRQDLAMTEEALRDMPRGWLGGVDPRGRKRELAYQQARAQYIEAAERAVANIFISAYGKDLPNHEAAVEILDNIHRWAQHDRRLAARAAVDGAKALLRAEAPFKESDSLGRLAVLKKRQELQRAELTRAAGERQWDELAAYVARLAVDAEQKKALMDHFRELSFKGHPDDYHFEIQNKLDQLLRDVYSRGINFKFELFEKSKSAAAAELHEIQEELGSVRDQIIAQPKLSGHLGNLHKKETEENRLAAGGFSREIEEEKRNDREQANLKLYDEDLRALRADVTSTPAEKQKAYELIADSWAVRFGIGQYNADGVFVATAKLAEISELTGVKLNSYQDWRNWVLRELAAGTEVELVNPKRFGSVQQFGLPSVKFVRIMPRKFDRLILFLGKPGAAAFVESTTDMLNTPFEDSGMAVIPYNAPEEHIEHEYIHVIDPTESKLVATALTKLKRLVGSQERFNRLLKERFTTLEKMMIALGIPPKDRAAFEKIARYSAGAVDEILKGSFATEKEAVIQIAGEQSVARYELMKELRAMYVEKILRGGKNFSDLRREMKNRDKGHYLGAYAKEDGLFNDDGTPKNPDEYREYLEVNEARWDRAIDILEGLHETLPREVVVSLLRQEFKDVDDFIKTLADRDYAEILEYSGMSESAAAFRASAVASANEVVAIAEPAARLKALDQLISKTIYQGRENDLDRLWYVFESLITNDFNGDETARTALLSHLKKNYLDVKEKTVSSMLMASFFEIAETDSFVKDFVRDSMSSHSIQNGQWDAFEFQDVIAQTKAFALELKKGERSLNELKKDPAFAKALHPDRGHYVARISKGLTAAQRFELIGLGYELVYIENANGEHYITIGAFRNEGEAFGRGKFRRMTHTHPPQSGVIPSPMMQHVRKHHQYDGSLQIRQGEERWLYIMAQLGDHRWTSRYRRVSSVEEAQSILAARGADLQTVLTGSFASIEQKARQFYYAADPKGFGAIAVDRDGTVMVIEAQPEGKQPADFFVDKPIVQKSASSGSIRLNEYQKIARKLAGKYKSSSADQRADVEGEAVALFREVDAEARRLYPDSKDSGKAADFRLSVKQMFVDRVIALAQSETDMDVLKVLARSEMRETADLILSRLILAAATNTNAAEYLVKVYAKKMTREEFEKGMEETLPVLDHLDYLGKQERPFLGVNSLNLIQLDGLNDNELDLLRKRFGASASMSVFAHKGIRYIVIDHSGTATQSAEAVNAADWTNVSAKDRSSEAQLRLAQLLETAISEKWSNKKLSLVAAKFIDSIINLEAMPAEELQVLVRRWIDPLSLRLSLRELGFSLFSSRAQLLANLIKERVNAASKAAQPRFEKILKDFTLIPSFEPATLSQAAAFLASSHLLGGKVTAANLRDPEVLALALDAINGLGSAKLRNAEDLALYVGAETQKRRVLLDYLNTYHAKDFGGNLKGSDLRDPAMLAIIGDTLPLSFKATTLDDLKYALLLAIQGRQSTDDIRQIYKKIYENYEKLNARLADHTVANYENLQEGYLNLAEDLKQLRSRLADDQTDANERIKSFLDQVEGKAIELKRMAEELKAFEISRDKALQELAEQMASILSDDPDDIKAVLDNADYLAESADAARVKKSKADIAELWSRFGTNVKLKENTLAGLADAFYAKYAGRSEVRIAPTTVFVVPPSVSLDLIEAALTVMTDKNKNSAQSREYLDLRKQAERFRENGGVIELADSLPHHITNEQVFGYYDARGTGKILLNLFKIKAFAQKYNISEADVTAIVLAHELFHANQSEQERTEQRYLRGIEAADFQEELGAWTITAQAMDLLNANAFGSQIRRINTFVSVWNSAPTLQPMLGAMASHAHHLDTMMADIKPRVIVVGDEAAKLGLNAGRNDVIKIPSDSAKIKELLDKLIDEGVDPNNIIFIVADKSKDPAANLALQVAFELARFKDKMHLVYEDLGLLINSKRSLADVSNDILDVAELMAQIGRLEIRTQLAKDVVGPQGQVLFTTVMSTMRRLLAVFHAAVQVAIAA